MVGVGAGVAVVGVGAGVAVVGVGAGVGVSGMLADMLLVVLLPVDSAG